MQKGKFIVFEGGEGSGKTTMAKKVSERFDALLTREPGGTPFAEKIREEVLLGELRREISPRTQFGLMWGARADHLEKLVIPALESGQHVICDRFDGSTYVYQVKNTSEGELEKAFLAMREAYLADAEPDLYLVFDAPAKVGMDRTQKRSGEVTVFDEKDIDFHERIRKSYLEFAAFAQVPAVVIDASQSLEKVEEGVMNEVQKIFDKTA